MLVWLGLFGLVASFHGIIMGSARQIFAMARAGYLPRRLATLHPTRGTPWVAILAGGLVGILAIFSDAFIVFGGQPLTANIVTMAVLGAMVMYISALASLFVLRAREPELPRSFPAIGYPWVPGLALVLAVGCLATVICGTLAMRLQPNHPADDVRGMLAAVLDGLMYGCGDAVIGVSRAESNRSGDQGARADTSKSNELPLPALTSAVSVVSVLNAAATVSRVDRTPVGSGAPYSSGAVMRTRMRPARARRR